MKSQISAKGQITIPKALRDSLGLRAGTRLRFEEQDGALVARKVEQEDALQEFVGVLQGHSDRWLREMRGPRWNPRLDPERLERPKGRGRQ